MDFATNFEGFRLGINFGRSIKHDLSLETQEVVPRAEPNCSSQTTRVPPERCRNSLGLTPLVGTFPPKGFEGTFPRTVRLNARHHLLGLEGQIVFYVAPHRGVHVPPKYESCVAH